MGDGAVLIGDDWTLARLLGVGCAGLDDPALALATLVLAPLALFGEAMARCAGWLPIVVLGSPASARARARLLDAGAADIVPAAIDPLELAARLRAIRRRIAPAPLVCGDLQLDPVERQVWRGGRPIALHPREYAVLACLMRAAGRPVRRAALYEAVWQRRFDPGTNVVAVTVSRLRARLDDRGPPLIATVGDGYRVAAPVVAG